MTSSILFLRFAPVTPDTHTNLYKLADLENAFGEGFRFAARQHHFFIARLNLQ